MGKPQRLLGAILLMVLVWFVATPQGQNRGFVLVNGALTYFGSITFKGGTSTGTLFINGSGNGFGVGSIGVVNSTPTISSGFGSGPSVTSSNGTATFRVNVGTGGAATSGVIGLPTATTGWNCQVTDTTNNTVTRQTAVSSTTVTVTAASAWAASDILIFNCWAY